MLKRLAQDRWAGFYAGVSVDAVTSTAQVGTSSVHDFKDKTANLGGFAGYNFVRGNGFVWGPELAVTAISTEGTATDTALGRSNFDGGFLVMPRLRGGFANDRAFYYGIVGLGITDVGARPAGASGRDVTVSPSIGIGAEFVLSDTWSTKIEAVHHKFDGPTFDFNGTSTQSRNKMTQFTLGFSRKF